MRRPLTGPLVFLFLAGCAGPAPTDAVLVGHLAPFSGPDKEAGEHAKQGILLALEKANDDGGAGGRKVAVLHVDTRGDPQALQPEAVRLISVNRAAALLGGADAAGAERLARAAQPYQVAVVTPSGLAATAAGDNLFPLGLTPASRGRILARFTRQELKPAGGVALVVDAASDARAALADAFAQEYRALGGTGVEEYPYRSKEDFPGLLERLRKAPPDVLLLAAAPADFAALRAKLPAEKPPAVLYGGPEAGITALQADRPAGDGAYLAVSYAADHPPLKEGEFAGAYRQRFGREPDLHAALAYEGAWLLFRALARARPLNPAAVREELAKAEAFDGGLTGKLTFGPGHRVTRPGFVVRLEEGRPRLVKMYEPEEK
jgi:branched-chain amino acid transport system substrate-binding protein